MVLFVWVSVSASPTPASEPVRIAAIFSLTGIAAKHNAPLMPMIKLGIEEINRQGGLFNQPVELMLLDNKSTPIGSHLAAKQAAQSDVTAIIGAGWRSHAIAIAKVAQANRIPMIATLHDESGLIGKMAQDAGVKSIPLGGDGWVSQAFYSKGGDRLKRADYCSHWSEFMDTDQSRSFLQKFGHYKSLDVGLALAYDAVLKARGLRFKINAAILCIAILIAFIFGVILYPFEIRRYQSRLKKINLLLETVFQQKNEEISNEIFAAQIRALQASLPETIAVEGVAAASIYRPDGMVNAATHDNFNAPLTSQELKTLSQAATFGLQSFANRSFAVYARKIIIIDRTSGYLKIYYDLEELNRETWISVTISVTLLISTIALMAWALKTDAQRR